MVFRSLGPSRKQPIQCCLHSGSVRSGFQHSDWRTETPGEQDEGMQVAELIITNPEAGQALEAVGFLGKFLHPISPSEVARALGMPANLAHHHARKYCRLGLLFEVGRLKGRVHYQLTARTFKVPEDLVTPGAYAQMVHRSAEAYLAAYERSAALSDRPDPFWTICSFGDTDTPTPSDPTRRATSEARPAYLLRRTLALSPERYRQLQAQLDALIQAEPDDRATSGTVSCTFTLLVFEGALDLGANNSTTISSFMDLQDPA